MVVFICNDSDDSKCFVTYLWSTGCWLVLGMWCRNLVLPQLKYWSSSLGGGSYKSWLDVDLKSDVFLWGMWRREGGVKTVGHLKADVDIKFKVLHAGIGKKVGNLKFDRSQTHTIWPFSWKKLYSRGDWYSYGIPPVVTVVQTCTEKIQK